MRVLYLKTGGFPMTLTANAAKPATLVPEARRMEFFPGLFGRSLMLVGGRAVFQFMSWLSLQDYTGGMWHFHELAGRPLFLSPASENRFRITCETNGYQGEVSAEAAGLIATLFALSHLSFHYESDQLAEAYLRLFAFVGDHPEAGEIFKAID
jgi:Antirestriction protein